MTMGYGTGLFRVKARDGVNAWSAVSFKNQSAFHHNYVLAVLYNGSYKLFFALLGQVLLLSPPLDHSDSLPGLPS